MGKATDAMIEIAKKYGLSDAQIEQAKTGEVKESRDTRDQRVREAYASRAQTANASKLSEAEFNRSASMQTNYGSYQNYLNGRKVTASGFYSPGSNIETQRAMNAASELQYELNTKAKQYAEEAGIFSPKAITYEDVLAFQGKLTRDQANRAQVKNSFPYQIGKERMAELDDINKRYREAAQRAMNGIQESVNWKSSIRNASEVQKDLDAIAKKIKDQQKLVADWRVKAGETGNRIGAVYETGARTQYEVAVRQLQELREQQALLNEEKTWDEYYNWDKRRSDKDFDKKAVYKPIELREDTPKEEYADQLLHEYLNGRKELERAYNMATNQDRLNGVTVQKEVLTKEELRLYNFLYETEGGKKATEYYNWLVHAELNARERMKDEEAIRRLMSEYGAGAKVLGSIATVAGGPLKAISAAGQLNDIINGKPLDPNAPYNRFTQLPDYVRNEVSKNWGAWGQFGYQTGMSMADFLWNTLITGGFSGLGGTAAKISEQAALILMGTEAMPSATIEAKERGLSDGQAITIGIISGLAEYVTEKVSLEALLDKAGMEKGFSYWLKNVLSEGSEELGSNWINRLADEIVAKDQAEWLQNVRALEKQGYDRGEAFQMVLRNQLIDDALSAAGGALSGGVMAAGALAINRVIQGKVDTEVGEILNTAEIDPEAMVKAGMDSESKKVAKYAEELQNKLDAGQEISDNERGRLYNLLADTMPEEPDAPEIPETTEVNDDEPKPLKLPKEENYGEVHRGDEGRSTIRSEGQNGILGERRSRQTPEQVRTAGLRANSARDVSQRVSSRELGLERGTDTRSVRVIPQENWDDELKNIGKRVQEQTGKPVEFVLGSIEIEGNDGTTHRVRGVWSDEKLIIQADNMRVSASQIADHEMYHDLAQNDRDLDRKIEAAIKEKYTEAEYDKVLQKYIQRLRGIIDIPEDGTDFDVDEAVRAIKQEIHADAYAGINAFEAKAGRFQDVTAEQAERSPYRTRQNVKATEETTGPPKKLQLPSVQESTEEDLEEVGFETVQEAQKKETELREKKKKLDEENEPVKLADGRSFTIEYVDDLEDLRYGDLGIRTVPVEQEGRYQRGDFVDDSFDWDYENDESTYFGDQTQLPGASAIKVNNMWLESVDELKYEIAKALDGRTYVGDETYLVWGDSGSEYGGDPGEVIIRDAKIVGKLNIERAQQKGMPSYEVENGRRRIYGDSYSEGWRARMNERFSADEEEQKKPVAKSLPTESKRWLRKNLMDSFSVPPGTRNEIGKMIDDYAERLIRNGELTEMDRRNLFARLYGSGVMTLEADEYSRVLGEAVRSGKIYVPESVKMEFGDDWQMIRRRAFAAGVYLTNNQNDRGADSWNEELSELFPGTFEPDNYDQRDIIERIVQIAEEGKGEKMILPEYMYKLAEREDLDLDEALDNLERKIEQDLRTFAEMAGLEVRLKDRTGIKLAEQRELSGKQLERQQAREAQRLAKIREERREMAQRQSQRRQLSELQQKVLRGLKYLAKNQMRAPEDLRSAWEETLGDIDLLAIHAADEMHYSKKYDATYRDLIDMYKEAEKNDPNFLPSKELQSIMGRVEGTHIGDMDIGQLQSLYRAVTGLMTEFHNRNNAIMENETKLFSELYEDSKKEIEGAAKGYTGKLTDRFLNTEQLTPINYLERMAGWNRDAQFFQMARRLEQAERRSRDFEVRAKRHLESLLNDQEYVKWLKTADGQGKDATWYEYSVSPVLELKMGDKPILGDPVTVYMTPMQKVHMYLESKNHDNLRHMLGGRTFADKELYSKGKRQEAFEQGHTIRLAPETVKRLVSDLTTNEMKMAKALSSFYNGYAADSINEVSNALYGYDKAMKGNYAPIFTNQNYVQKEIGVFEATAAGVGNLKARVYSKNPSYNISALDAFERNVNQTKRFVGVAIAERNWNMLLNWREKNNSMGDVITHKWGGEAKNYITDLIQTLQGGRNTEEKTVLDKIGEGLLSNYVGATFGANPGITLKQAASYPQFAAVLGWDTMPAKTFAAKVDEELVNVYTSELAYRALGYATPETAQLKDNPTILQTNKAMNFAFGGGTITAMDVKTVKSAWAWAENYVRKYNPDLEMGTQKEIQNGESPFYKEVARVYEDAVSLTQPMYDEMHRAKIMKDSKGLRKAFTMFKTVSLQQYNTLRRSFGELQYAKGQYAAKATEENKARLDRAAKSAADSVTATIASIAALEAIEFLVQLFKNRAKRYRDDDDELTAGSIGKNAALNAIGDAAGMVIAGREITDIMKNWFLGEKWYGIEIPGGEQLNDVLDSITDAVETVNGLIKGGFNVVRNGGNLWDFFRKNARNYAGAMKTIAQKTAMYLGGFPVDNLEKYVMGIVKFWPGAEQAINDVFTTPTKKKLNGLTGDALSRGVKDYLKNRGIDADNKELARLYESGNKKAVPADTPSSVKIDGEDVVLSDYEKQVYEKEFAKLANVKDLMKTDAYKNADDPTREKMLDKLYDYAAEKAKAAALEGYTQDEATDKADKLIEAGMTPAQWAAWAAETSELKNAEKIDLLGEKGFGDEVTKALAISMFGEETETESGNDTKYGKFLELSKTMDAGNALRLADVVTDVDRFNEVRKTGVSEEMALEIQKSQSDTDKFMKLVDSGLSGNDAYDLMEGFEELAEEAGEDGVKNIQKWREVIDTFSDTEKQMIGLQGVMSESQYQKLQAAREYNVEPNAYVRLVEAMWEAYPEQNGRFKNAQIEEVIDSITNYDLVLPGGDKSMQLTTEQQAALWQLLSTSSSAKNNPYSRSVGQGMLDLKKSFKDNGEDYGRDTEAMKLVLPSVE